jgi:hypothetical protein
VRKTLFYLRKHHPLTARKLMRVKKQVNAKGMGLFASAFIMLFENTGDRRFLHKAVECMDWLKRNYNRSYPGMSWGYPFDWKSYVFIPWGTPSGVVTSTVGDAFWRYYKLTGSREYLKICSEISEFFIRGLNIDVLGDDEVVFSYTPLDRTHIHNANLFVADFLMKTGLETGRNDFVDLAKKAVNYTLSQVNPDGSIYYLGKEQAENPDEPDLDNYHSGFEIRTLHSIYLTTGDNRVEETVKNYLAFYLSSYFEEGEIPRIRPGDTYPVSIHSCSESIITLSILGRRYPECLGFLGDIVPWVIDNMQNRDGSFKYERRKRNGRIVDVKIPYIRWGQAWMLRAFAEYMKLQNELIRGNSETD